MKRIFTSLMLCFSMLSVFGQPQRSGFRQLIATGETPVNMRSLTAAINFNPSAGFTPELSQKYARERMLDDMRTVFLPYYRPHLSHDDITFILAVLHSPDVRQALHHMEILKDGNNMERGQYIGPSITKITAGETPENIKLKEGVNQEYLQAITAYYKASGQADQLEQTQKHLSAANPEDNGVKNLVKILDFITTNNPTIMANMAYGKVSIDELKLMTSFYETKAFQHFRAGNQALSADSQNVLSKLMEMAMDWKHKNELAQ